ncbi:hypothetical protein ONZ45_g15587 [Pleurotus djamor]|nr:hypothetical protein ONZ45_g15587 [Pleurotus djamor]
MPWPVYVSNAFEAIPGGFSGTTDVDESLFYGPYNALLTFLFPPTDNYIISPQVKRPPEGWSVDFSTVFVVQRAFHPVFFLEIKSPGHFSHRSSRAAADAHMRAHFFELADTAKLPVTHGVSALGTRLCFYSYTKDNDTLQPLPIVPDPNRMTDVAPAARWDFDVLSDEGVEKMTQIANEVKTMVVQRTW